MKIFQKQKLVIRNERTPKGDGNKIINEDFPKTKIGNKK